MNPNDLIFFGDSKSDLLAAKTCNINFILIMNAHNTSLQKNFDCKKINDFNELL
jgi:acid phosphatase class B